MVFGFLLQYIARINPATPMKKLVNVPWSMFSPQSAKQGANSEYVNTAMVDMLFLVNSIILCLR